MNAQQKNFETYCREQLNAEQLSAVEPESGILVVRAGAGSGKTRVITTRMMSLILNHNVAPRSIVGLTFTNKAAREMSERISRFLPEDHVAPIVGTFHSYCVRLLKQYGHFLGLGAWSILDSSDREQLLKQIIKRLGAAKGITATTAGSVISRHKNEITRRTTVHLPPLVHDARQYQEIFVAYEREKHASHCLDFDDLLLEALRLFHHSEFRALFHAHVQHLLVDEYQDTNRVQHALIAAMSHRSDDSFALRSLCIVGDEDQSIYSWRGATIENLLHFSHKFPAARSVAITRNYRSVQQVLDAANAVIGNNRSRAPKQLWSTKTGENRVKMVTCSSAYHEADLIAQTVQPLVRMRALNSVAILYRSHYQSRTLEEAMIRYSIPYRIIGGTQFYDRQEIKDLLAYLRLSVNQHDRVSFMRAINTPARGLGDAFLEQWIDIWDQNSEYTIFEVAHVLVESKRITGVKLRALQTFIAFMSRLVMISDAATAIQELISEIDFFEYLAQQFDATEARERSANVHELVNAISLMQKRGTNTVAEFLDEVALLQEHLADDAESADYIRMMTIHSAKGLEFDTVIVPGLEEGIFPSPYAVAQSELIEEERRLMYVAMTRARERLLMMRAQQRVVYGMLQDQVPSRFIAELPGSVVVFEDLTRWSSRMPSPLASWIGGSLSFRSAAVVHEQRRAPSQDRSSGAWHLHQEVVHPTFGVGKIVFIDRHSPPHEYLTIQFQGSLKKIASSFVRPR